MTLGIIKSLCVISIIFSTAAAEEPLPASLWNKNVTFALPPHWRVQRHFADNSREMLQLLIPDPDTDSTDDSSNACITVEPLHRGDTVKSFGDTKLQLTSDPSYIIITDIPAGKKWRTVLSSVHQGKTPYVIFDRYGVDADCMVALRIVFPIIKRKDADWMKRMVAECNSIQKSLKIRNRNFITSELKNDSGVVWLKDFKDPSETF